MSGRKERTVSVSESELRRLRMQAARATSLDESVRILNQLDAKNNAALRDYQNRINNLNTNINSLNNRLAAQSAAASREAQELRNNLQCAIKDSNARIQQMARQNEQRVQAMHENFTRDLQTARENTTRQINQTRREFTQAMESNNRRIESVMQQNNEQLRGEIHSLGERVDAEIRDIRSDLNNVEAAIQTANSNHQALLEMAREYDNSARLVMTDLMDNFRVELLCPGRSAQVNAALENSVREINDAAKIPQNAATARLLARNALEEAFRLRQEVIAAEQEWNMHFEAARQAVDATASQLDASRTMELEEEGNFQVDVDHWTSGDLTSLDDRVQSLDGQLRKPEELTLDDLDAIKEAGLEVSREIEDTAVFALEAFSASQDRAEIAQEVKDRLDQLGIMIVNHSYQGDDQRRAHRLHMKNPRTGFEIVVTQTPIVLEDGSVANRLESDIMNYGSSRNIMEGHEIAGEVMNALNGLGFNDTPVTTVTGYDSRESDRVECVDFQQWRARQVTETIKPNHVVAGTSAGVKRVQ